MTAQNAGDTGPRALLPNGLRDVLPPEAAQESEAVRTLLDYMRGFGYQLVKPPLVEFEGSLLDGASPKMGTRIFRVMDPVSQRMMGVRADMTMQIARIATTRLYPRSAPPPGWGLPTSRGCAQRLTARTQRRWHPWAAISAACWRRCCRPAAR